MVNLSRRKFLGIFGGATIASSIPKWVFADEFPKPLPFSETEIDEFCDFVIDEWHKKKHKMRLDWEQFFYLKQICERKFFPISENDRTQKQKDIIFIFNSIKYFYFTILTRVRINNELHTYSSDSSLILTYINDYQKNVEGNVIYFEGINRNFMRTLYGFCKKERVNYKVAFIIATIENNFGNNVRSSANAMGPMQVKAEAIRDMEIKYGFQTKYAQLSESDKYIRGTHLGVLYIKYIIELLGLDISVNHIDKIDFIILLLCYNQGISGILTNYDKPYNLEGVNYVKKGLSGLNYTVALTENPKLKNSDYS